MGYQAEPFDEDQVPLLSPAGDQTFPSSGGRGGIPGIELVTSSTVSGQCCSKEGALTC